VLGHNFPIYLNFHGGKGVATSLGVVLGVYPYLTLAGLLAFAVWIVVTLVSRFVSAGSVVAATALPLLLVVILRSAHRAAWSDHWPLVAFAVLAAALVIYRHRANIARLRAGTENRIGAGRQPPASQR
jgi:glycerol-3-phosphate acyltransferase PlsY